MKLKTRRKLSLVSLVLDLVLNLLKSTPKAPKYLFNRTQLLLSDLGISLSDRFGLISEYHRPIGLVFRYHRPIDLAFGLVFRRKMLLDVYGEVARDKDGKEGGRWPNKETSTFGRKCQQPR
ncbi:hypothetical protein COLO4_06658 [Corchorus olitorius]|uniref:Uncharacterized protein n=1 Tax=Corchorus olitorius TaxID=93759 RepID=A0A1R3KMF8_9ROSI|nr:hypothetical protein COLO4_06658 [Corchorus olitorius]